MPLRRGWPNNAKRSLELDAPLARTFRRWPYAKKTRQRKTCQTYATRRMRKTSDKIYAMTCFALVRCLVRCCGAIALFHPLSAAARKNPKSSSRSMMPKAEISKSLWYEKHDGWK